MPRSVTSSTATGSTGTASTDTDTTGTGTIGTVDTGATGSTGATGTGATGSTGATGTGDVAVRIQTDAAVQSNLNRVLSTLGIKTTVQQVQDQQATTSSQQRSQRRGLAPSLFGKNLPQAGLAAAAARQGCAQAFKSGPKPDEIRATISRFHVLSDAESRAQATLTAIRDEIAKCKTTLTDQTMSTYKIVSDANNNPWFPEDSKELLAVSSEDLMALASGRLDARNAAAGKTRAGKNSDASLQDDNAKLNVKNKYLSGQELRPGDVILQPKAARSGSRSKKSSPTNG